MGGYAASPSIFSAYFPALGSFAFTFIFTFTLTVLVITTRARSTCTCTAQHCTATTQYSTMIYYNTPHHTTLRYAMKDASFTGCNGLQAQHITALTLIPALAQRHSFNGTGLVPSASLTESCSAVTEVLRYYWIALDWKPQFTIPQLGYSSRSCWGLLCSALRYSALLYSALLLRSTNSQERGLIAKSIRVQCYRCHQRINTVGPLLSISQPASSGDLLRITAIHTVLHRVGLDLDH